MAKEINGRFYLDKGDEVEANMVEMAYDGKKGWTYRRMNGDSEIRVWGESDEEWYNVNYAFDLPQSDENYGKPYFEK